MRTNDTTKTRDEETWTGQGFPATHIPVNDPTPTHPTAPPSAPEPSEPQGQQEQSRPGIPHVETESIHE